MKLRRTIKATLATLTVLTLSAAASWSVLGQHSVRAAARSAGIASSRGSTMAMPLGLPTEDAAKAVLDASLPRHHPQWVDVPMGSVKIHTFVIYPDLSGTAPLAVITAHNQGMTDWVRAVGTEVVNQGYITVVPDLLSGLGPNGGGTDSFANREAIALALGQLGASEIQRRTDAVRDYFARQPGSNGKSAVLDFNWSENRLDTAITTPTERRVVRFDLTEHAWHNTLALLAAAPTLCWPSTNQHPAAESVRTVSVAKVALTVLRIFMVYLL